MKIVKAALRPLALAVGDWNARRLQRRLERRRRAEYRDWIVAHDELTAERAAAWKTRAAALPPIGLLMTVGAQEAALAAATIDSLRAQLHTRWRLAIVADPALVPALPGAWREDTRVAIVDRAQLPDEPWLALPRAGDRWPAHALAMLAAAAVQHEGTMLVYADEDELDAAGERCGHDFKPDWNPELLLSGPYLGRALLMRADHVRACDALVVSADPDVRYYELALRCTAALPAAAIVHVPHVLCHRHPSPVRPGAALRDAASRHLRRVGVHGSVDGGDDRGWRVHVAPPAAAPLVSIIVPTRDRLDLLRPCIDSVRTKTDYAPIEIIIVDNGSREPATRAWFERVSADARVRIVRDDRPFNYAALNNAAVAVARGDYVLLLNNDTEVINPGWLGEMLGLAALPGVGAVGARLWFDDRSLQHAGLVLGLDGVAGYAHRRLRRGAPGYNGRAQRLQAVSAVTAACLLVRRALYLEVGGLDAQTFAVAYNDVDFCLRLVAAGYRNVWTPEAQLYHYESKSRGSDQAPERVARFEREFAAMRERWGARLDADPAYNPNLALAGGAYNLAWPPRIAPDQLTM